MTTGQNFSIAVVGATGLVGQELIKILLQRNFPVSSIRLLASELTAGRKIIVRHEEIEVREIAPDSFTNVNIAFFSMGSEASRYFIPFAVQSGAVVVDNSAAFRLEPDVPLIIPEINMDDCKNHRGVVATPNCTTIQIAMALHPLHKVNPIKRVLVATYQSVSGTGAAAIDELRNQTRQVLDGQTTSPHVYPHQIAFNVLPEIDVFRDDGYTREEWKIIKETQRVMHANTMAVSATCVRVPVLIGHSAAVNVELTNPTTVDDIERIIAQSPGVKLLDDTTISLYPQPWAIVGSDDVFIGRLRQDVSLQNGICMWLVVDNLRKGAALNAVQVAEELIKRDWLRPRR